jgi:broad specificity phosphatase PhoE
MDRLIVVRHGGSTGNEDASFYDYNDSAICLTTNGIRQALATAEVLRGIDPTWAKPGDFNLEVFASEYTRAQQTARIALDQMGLLSVAPTITALLNERNYGTTYLPAMDTDPAFDGNQSESSIRARARVRAIISLAEHLLERADVLWFSHFGTMRAIIADLLRLSDTEMMTTDVQNGQAFLFQRTVDDDGRSIWKQVALPEHVLAKTAPPIAPPPALVRPATRS